MKDYNRPPSPNTRITIVRDGDLTIPHDAIWRRIEARQRANRSALRRRVSAATAALLFFLICFGVQCALMGLLVAIGVVKMAVL